VNIAKTPPQQHQLCNNDWSACYGSLFSSMKIFVRECSAIYATVPHCAATTISPWLVKKYKGTSGTAQPQLTTSRSTQNYNKSLRRLGTSASLSKMKAQITIAVLIAATSASAKCIQDGEHCEWFGSSPFCGSTKSDLWDKDSSGRVLRVTTKLSNCGKACLYQRGSISGDCYIDYGYTCISGYKRLWCYPK
jgi:hypothetical protein